VPLIRTLAAFYCRLATPEAHLSFCAALALVAVAGIARTFDTFLFTWEACGGMLWVSGFYFVVGLDCLNRRRRELAAQAAARERDAEPWGAGVAKSPLPGLAFRATPSRRRGQGQARPWDKKRRFAMRD
jgi:hypothetical protein